MAQTLIKGGGVRIDGSRVVKTSALISASNVLTIAYADQIKILRFILPGIKRGPAIEAQLLYEDLSPPKISNKDKKSNANATAVREPGSGRPTKKQRRQTDQLKDF
ncbi:Ribosome-associated heat shock protein implicated in the recycling of the 50S subunit (S4 paralog) [hydrothermal vent metagenome]|uniref:Ribosome-associated heat shock protein implicated in the recycling of the 50S subunit (S4 paralog) n=1 Tax=hydrothermal vent metagenome TaxID=652676 RepID=A0A3B0TXU1_9ZZZZ